jgi:hypothetical protein
VIPTSDVSWPVAITAELLYQPVSYGFVQDLGLDGGEYVDRYLDFSKTADHAADLVDSVTVTMEK